MHFLNEKQSIKQRGGGGKGRWGGSVGEREREGKEGGKGKWREKAFLMYQSYRRKGYGSLEM